MADLGSGPLPLVGRDPELRRIRSFLDETVAGGSTLLMSGEPGVGKTALLSAAAEMAAAGGVRVIRAGGVEYETDVSFAGLHQLVDPLGADLRRLPRPGRASLESALGLGDGPVPDRLAVWSATLALFRLAAASRPLLVVVDDSHWLDRATGAVIGFVGRRLGGSRIGLLGAVRPGAGGFFERAGLAEVDVAPLPKPDAMDLLARRFAHLPIRVLRRVAADAQGNPLALLEFAASAGLRQHGGRPPPQGSSREVRTLFQARVERLPAPTRRLLLLAVLDGTGRLDVLAAASGAGLVELGPAERDHLVVVDERLGEVRLRHPMIRSVVVERSTLGERHRDQRTAARARDALRRSRRGGPRRPRRRDRARDRRRRRRCRRARLHR